MNHSALTLAYCTNIWSHHQVPVCTELARQLGADRFRMCLFEPIHAERRQMGWSAGEKGLPWVAGPPESPPDMKALTKLVCDAEVAVLGAVPLRVVEQRVRTGKPTFIMGERLNRRPLPWWRLLSPRGAVGRHRMRRAYNRASVHYLPIGHFAASDARQLGLFTQEMWTWAYFVTPSGPFVSRGHEGPRRLLWAGRYLGCKRVDLLIEALSKLPSDVPEWRLDLIGNGEHRPEIERMVNDRGLNRFVSFLDSIPADEVRERMRACDIYILPSNREEGWGAVVSEAMTEGCAVIANREAGSAEVLIEHRKSGMLFDDGDIVGLRDCIETLLRDDSLRDGLQKSAWERMATLWHPRVGAERLIHLSLGRLGHQPLPNYADGPCAKVSPGRLLR